MSDRALQGEILAEARRLTAQGFTPRAALIEAGAIVLSRRLSRKTGKSIELTINDAEPEVEVVEVAEV